MNAFQVLNLLKLKILYMTERQMLMRGIMVRPTLAGYKHQTRRTEGLKEINLNPDNWNFVGKGINANKKRTVFIFENQSDKCDNAKSIMCPKGEINDHLYIRETYALESNVHQYETDYLPPFSDGRPTKWSENDYGELIYWEQPHYRATDNRPELVYETMPEGVESMCRWKPSLFMPRWASRIFLEITDIRVERLKDISQEDAIAEGLKAYSKDLGITTKYGIPDREGLPGGVDEGWKWTDWEVDPRAAYKRLWESINGKGSWDKNPWVWVIKFKRVEVPSGSI